MHGEYVWVRGYMYVCRDEGGHLIVAMQSKGVS